MDALQILGEAKNYWNAIHAVADKLAEKSVAGRVYIFLQGTAGSTIVDSANGDTIDEQLVGIVGDVLGGFVLSVTGVGFAVNVKLIADGNSPGDMLKSTYQFIKYSDGQYWKYEKDFQTMGATGYMVVPYAKVLYTKVTNGPDVVVPDGTRPAYYQEINETTYFQYMQTKQALVNEINTAQLNTLIENSNGVLKVTMPDGTVYAQGDDIANTLVGGIKDDYLNGGAGADRLEGGNGFDRYIANNGDTISDIDGKGEVYFGGLLLTGGSKEAGQSCESDGEGKSVYKGNGGTYTLSDGVLQFTDSSANHVRIEGFKNGYLGINLEGHPADDEECEEGKDEQNVEGSCPKPITPKNIFIPLPSQSIGGGGSGGSSSVDTPIFACVYTPELNSAGIGGGGSSTGPIVLDLNRNGITSISLATSQALFDYDGNGVKESSAWSESSDALLVNDINQDGLWHVAQNNTYFKIKREVA